MIADDSLYPEIQLTKKIASSGEGEVWITNRSGYLAKIYKEGKRTPQRMSKLQAMIKNPPKDPTYSQKHISIAWPCELLYQNTNFVGFLMPEIKNAKELTDVYIYDYRKFTPTFNWRYLHLTACNVASIVWGLHEKNYIVGDMKPQNLLVNDRGLVSIIDTDSFQVTDSATNTVHYCPVDTPEFTPPELIGRNISQTKQTKFHDCYRLAIIIHLLLFGYHPFQAGKWNDSGEGKPEFSERVKDGLWIYAINSKYTDVDYTIPLNVVAPEIKNLFLRAFNDGYKDPRLRPSAKEWYEALNTAISKLTLCSQVHNHVYTLNYGKCYWCERENQVGFDTFYAPNSNVSASSIPPLLPVNTLQEKEKEKVNVWVPVIFVFSIVLLLFMLSRLVG